MFSDHKLTSLILTTKLTLTPQRVYQRIDLKSTVDFLFFIKIDCNRIMNLKILILIYFLKIVIYFNFFFLMFFGFSIQFLHNLELICNQQLGLMEDSKCYRAIVWSF